MNRIVVRLFGVTMYVAAALALAGGTPAAAHEGRTGGALQFTVGWGDEPAFTGIKNSLQVTITEATSKAPVTDVADTLTVEVIKGSEKLTAPLVANFRVGGSGTPGDYRVWLTPTRPGSYTFRLMGTVRGQKVDESFSSSKTTFNDVEDVTSIQFPAKDPTPSQLATRVDREVPRLVSAIAKAEAQAGSARTLALAGVAVGALGFLAAASTLILTRKRDGRHGGGHDSHRLGDGSGTPVDQPRSLRR